MKVFVTVLLVCVGLVAADNCFTECTSSSECPTGWSCQNLNGCASKCYPSRELLAQTTNFPVTRQIICAAPCSANILLRQLGLGSCNPGYICMFDGICHSCLKVSGKSDT
uniref:WAP domain-containing protein n=1 Tax=Biomphalaria glabrata TaxID=6526 RepID=A0A2C9LLY0_BIOGL